MADDLTWDLLTEILSRLPVQSLLRFQSTSKSLKSLIDSLNFTNLHLKNSLNLNLILWRRPEFYQIDLPNLTTTISLNHHIGYKHDVVLLGSCNGLLCISNIFNEIALWNPNINKHQTIPYLPFPESRYFSRLPGGNIIFHGFGFDPLAGDYKLIRISCPYKLIRRSCPVTMNQQPGTFESQVRLFSSKRNSWKVLPNMPYALYNDDDMNVAVENSLHLVVSRKPGPIQQCLIVAFN